MKFSKFLPVAFMSLGLLVGCGDPKPENPPVDDTVYTVAINNKTDLAAEWLVGGTPRTFDLTVTADGEQGNALAEVVAGNITFEAATAGVVSFQGLTVSAVAVGTTEVTVKYYNVTDTVTFTVVETPAEPEIITGKTCAEVTEEGTTVLNTRLYEVRGKVVGWGKKDAPNQYGEFTVGDDTGTVYFYGSYVNTTAEPATFDWSGESYKVTYTARNFLTADMTKDLKLGDEVVIIAMHDKSYDNFYGIFVSVTPGAEVPATSVSLSKTTLTVTEGLSETLTATVLPANCNQSATWTSSNEAVATVDKTGKVTGVKVGTATITVTVGTVSATCAVTVEAAAAGVVTLTADNLGLGAYAAGTATVGGVEFGYTELGSFGDGIQMRINKNDSSLFSTLFNKTAFASDIDSISLQFSASKSTYNNTDAFKFEFANNADFSDAEEVKLSTVSGTKAYTVTPTGSARYFRMTILLSYSFYWESIAINLK